MNPGSAGFLRSDGRWITCGILDTGRRTAEIFYLDFPADRLSALGPYHASLSDVLARRNETEEARAQPDGVIRQSIDPEELS